MSITHAWRPIAALALVLWAGEALAQASGGMASPGMSPSLSPLVNNQTARACVPDRGSPAIGWPAPASPDSKPPPRAPLCTEGGAAGQRLAPIGGPGITGGR